MRDRYTILVGLLFVAVIAIAFLGGVGGKDDGILGLGEKPARWPLPEFAVPSATSGLELDANIAQDDCAGARLPCPTDDRRDSACRIDSRDAIRLCDLFGRPLVLSFWFTKGGSECVDQQDVVDSVAERYRGRVNFLSLNVLDDLDTVRELIDAGDWKMPVGYDRDGAVASLYRVGLCPTFAYVYPGGTLQSASVGILTAGQLGTRIEALLRATREAETG